MALLTTTCLFANASPASDCYTPTPLGAIGKFAGETIAVLGPWDGANEDLVNVVLDCFEIATGAKVEYSDSGEFETESATVTHLRSSEKPNVAIFPQPGLAADLAREGLLVELGDNLAFWMRENYGASASWFDLGTYPDPQGDSRFYGFAYKVSVKSLVWYSPAQFQKNGYEIPITMEALIELSDQMIADGNTRWCIGIE